MTDPMSALVQLQIALDSHAISPAPCEIHKDILVEADQPSGSPRYTYFKHKDSNVHAIALFTMTEPIEGTPCFQMGWATLESERGLGYATGVAKKGIEELAHGLRRHGITKFYLEAIISRTNEPSIRLATKLLSGSPKECTDSISSEPALQFIKLAS